MARWRFRRGGALITPKADSIFLFFSLNKSYTYVKPPRPTEGKEALWVVRGGMRVRGGMQRAYITLDTNYKLHIPEVNN
jgi:hypothetical protein